MKIFKFPKFLKRRPDPLYEIVARTPMKLPNQEFRDAVPKFHESPKALAAIGKLKALADVYCAELLRLYQNRLLPLEIEEAIIEAKSPLLTTTMEQYGYVWSHEAEALMHYMRWRDSAPWRKMFITPGGQRI